MSSSPAAKTANVVFDPHGDCILVLPCSRGNTRFRVYSQILCHASPVFQAMLGTSSGFREGQTLASRSSASPPLDVPIADDDPPALATVLRILHRQYDWVPESITSDQLFHIAVICDKYDMRQALEDWLKKWLEKLTTNRSGDKWLFMAYAFQRADLFAKLSKELILNTSTSGFESFNRYIPESIIDELSTRREQVIQSMVDCIHHLVEQYYTLFEAGGSQKLQCALQNEACDSFVLGFLLRTFKGMNVYPESSTSSTTSINEFQNLLKRQQPCPSIISFDGATICNCSTAINTYTRCYGCGINRSCTISQINHAITCSPLPKFQNQIKEIVERVEGLEFSRFLRPKLGDDNVGAPVGEKVWDYLQYT